MEKRERERGRVDAGQLNESLQPLLIMLSRFVLLLVMIFIPVKIYGCTDLFCNINCSEFDLVSKIIRNRFISSSFYYF